MHGTNWSSRINKNTKTAIRSYYRNPFQTDISLLNYKTDVFLSLTLLPSHSVSASLCVSVSKSLCGFALLGLSLFSPYFLEVLCRG